MLQTGAPTHQSHDGRAAARPHLVEHHGLVRNVAAFDAPEADVLRAHGPMSRTRIQVPLAVGRPYL